MGDPLDDYVQVIMERRLLARVIDWARSDAGELELDELWAEDDRSRPVSIPLELLRRVARQRKG